MKIDSRATVVLVLGLASALMGCGGGGGGGGGVKGGGSTSSGSTSSGSTGTGGTTVTGSAGFVANDFDEPTLTVTAPARGAYLTWTTNPAGKVDVEGTAVDTGDGIAQVTVNGVSVAFAPNGSFKTSVALVKGANEILVTATDHAGNQARSVRSVVFADWFAPAQTIVNRAVGARVNEGALNAVAPLIVQKIVAGQLIDQLLLNGGQPIWGDYNRLPSWLGGGCYIAINITITQVSYGTPQLVFDCTPQGDIVATLKVPNFDVRGDASDGCGIPWPTVSGDISASEVDVTLAVTAAVDPTTHQVVITGQGANVGMQNYNFNFTNLPGQILNVFTLGQIGGAVRSPIENAIATAIENDLPPKLGQALNGFFGPTSRTWGGRTVTFNIMPGGVSVDDNGITFDCAANVTGPLAPTIPNVPGAYFDSSAGAALPIYPPVSPNLSVSVQSNAWNQALFTSWQAGFWDLMIDQRFLNALGINAPFALDSNMLRSFVPGIASFLPPGSAPIPVAIETELMCQPILVPTPAGPTVARLELPELHLRVMIDPGTGFVALWEFAVHMEVGVDFSIVNGNELAVAIGANPRFDAETLSTALPTNAGIDWGRAFSQIVPGVLSIVASSVKPFPLPNLGVSTPLAINNPHVIVDGQAADYLTVNGDL